MSILGTDEGGSGVYAALELGEMAEERAVDGVIEEAWEEAGVDAGS